MTYLYYLLSIYGYGLYKGSIYAFYDNYDKPLYDKLKIISNYTFLSIPGIIFYLAEDINQLGDTLSKHFD